MKRTVNIFPLIILYLLLCSKGCNDNEQQSQASEQLSAGRARDSITSVFEADRPGRQALQAYQLTAIQKFSDLADYLKVAVDSSAGPAFRQKAAEMASCMFVAGKQAPVFLAGAVVDSVWISGELQQASDSMYAGELSFVLQIPQKNGPGSKTRAGKAGFFAVKQDKAFGKDTLRVWNVLLGDIR